MTKQVPQDQYVKVGDIRTRYWAVGDGKSAVILLHGLGRYIEQWEDNIIALAQNRRVYALDLVGAGCSDKPHVIYSLPYLTEFLHKFMSILGIERAYFNRLIAWRCHCHAIRNPVPCSGREVSFVRQRGSGQGGIGLLAGIFLADHRRSVWRSKSKRIC